MSSITQRDQSLSIDHVLHAHHILEENPKKCAERVNEAHVSVVRATPYHVVCVQSMTRTARCARLRSFSRYKLPSLPPNAYLAQAKTLDVFAEEQPPLALELVRNLLHGAYLCRVSTREEYLQFLQAAFVPQLINGDPEDVSIKTKWDVARILKEQKAIVDEAQKEKYAETPNPPVPTSDSLDRTLVTYCLQHPSSERPFVIAESYFGDHDVPLEQRTNALAKIRKYQTFLRKLARWRGGGKTATL